ncbi:MAG: hypothetical protein H7122_09570 [Chitinophagaceae bacterium]|nr:hypothetical protein [Chitinophagaceae bacterium]
MSEIDFKRFQFGDSGEKDGAPTGHIPRYEFEQLGLDRNTQQNQIDHAQNEVHSNQVG